MKIKLKDLEIIPSELYISEVLSADNCNLWELHELSEEQEITIKIKQNEKNNRMV